MNIFELIRRDHEQFRTLFDLAEERGPGKGRLLAAGFSKNPGKAGEPDDFDENYFIHSFLLDEQPREVSLDEIDDHLAVDLWLREIARG
ncbi:MAG: hypothetical protein HY913_12090 [Desulfomonile tiedjei]|nr:hypothetical protein [Desulfomonile tiedjei]